VVLTFLTINSPARGASPLFRVFRGEGVARRTSGGCPATKYNYRSDGLGGTPGAVALLPPALDQYSASNLAVTNKQRS
jgi:hypothetical protein